MPTAQDYTVQEIKDLLLQRIDQVVHKFAPPVSGAFTDHQGKYFTLNPGREDRSVGSFVVNMRGARAGYWQDFATGQHGDIIDLIALYRRCSNAEAIREARQLLGLERETDEDRARRKADAARFARERERAAERNAAEQAERSRRAVGLWHHSVAELRGTPVHRYLQDVRRVDLDRLRRQPGALRYRPDCRYYHVDQETGEVTEGTYPAMVALIQNLAGEPVGVHRTYLAQNAAGCWDKAPVPKAKLTLGPWAGGHISIWKGIGPRGGKPCGLKDVPPDTHLFITEGIEDAMSVVDLLPEARVICAISLSCLGTVQLPANVSSVTLVADRDTNPDAQAALDDAIAAHQAAGRQVRLFQNNWGGKDLNDALRAAREGDEE